MSITKGERGYSLNYEEAPPGMGNYINKQDTVIEKSGNLTS